MVLGAPQIRCTRLNSSGHENVEAFSFSFLASLSSLRPGGRSPGPAAIAASGESEWFVFFRPPALMPRGKRAAEEPKAQEKEEKQPAKGKKKKDDPKSKDEAAKAPSAAPAAPKPPTEEETVERVRVLDRGVRESRQNINNCVELVQILREVRRARSLCSVLCASSADDAGALALSPTLCFTASAGGRASSCSVSHRPINSLPTTRRCSALLRRCNVSSSPSRARSHSLWTGGVRAFAHSAILFDVVGGSEVWVPQVRLCMCSCTYILSTWDTTSHTPRPALISILSALPLDKVSSPEEVLANWLCKHHASFHDALVHLLGHKEPTLQVTTHP